MLITYLDFGGTARRLPIITAGFAGLSLWIFACLVFRKNTREISNATVIKILPYYVVFALTLTIGITVHTGIRAAVLTQTFGTPIHRRIRQWRTETRIDLEGINILDQGIEGLFSSIDQEVDLPNILYLTNDIGLQFNRTGEVTSFSANIYGRNQSGGYEGFMIYTDDDTNQIVVSEQGTRSNREVDEEMRVSPLINTFNQLSLVEIMQEWPNEDEFELFYMGYRSFGYNREGIYYLEDHGPIELTFAEDEIEGFAVSISVVGKTEEITPNRYIDRSYNPDIEQIRSEDETTVELGYQKDESEQEIYFLTEDIGYRLPVIDAATGSRWYGFEQTVDGGEVWETVNPDPFNGRYGRSNGLVFLDEALGFAVIARGSQGTLFRTEDGGLTFSSVDFPEVEVPLTDDEDYSPFQYPEAPYEDEGTLYVLVGQGAEGDYNMGAKALYESTDAGETWQFVEEVNE